MNGTIQLPLDPATPEETRRELEQLLARQAKHGVADTVAYLTEEEVMRAAGRLEELGYDRSTLQGRVHGPAATRGLFPFPAGPVAKPSPLAGEGRVRGE